MVLSDRLCRQFWLKPNKLLILELNEFALYKIHEELKLNKNIKIVPLISNAQDQKIKPFATFKVNTVYHAAAYKHVPLVEENICEGKKQCI